MSRLHALAWLLVVLGASVGTAIDPVPDAPRDTRGGYVVLHGDFHVHTRFSEGLLSPFDVVLSARREGLDIIGVTEHNIAFPGAIAAWFSELIGGPTVLVGQELTTRGFHLILLGLTERIHWQTPLEAAIEQTHAQGGVAIAAHPVERFWSVFDPVIPSLDGAEVMHPIALRQAGGRRGWKWQDMPDFYKRAKAKNPTFAAIGSSDFHGFKMLGVCRTLVFAKDDRPSSILEAIRTGKTVVFDADDNAYGDEAVIALLEDAPLERRHASEGYAPAGPLDLLARALGWLGVLGVLVLRRTRDGIGSAKQNEARGNVVE